MKRRAFMAALALLPLARPAAAQKKGEPTEFYAALPPLTLEFWDKQGLFHMVNFSLTVVFDKQGMKASKKLGDSISQALSSMPWEEFKDGNPAVTIKNIAYDIVRADREAGPSATDVLIIKLMIR